MSQQGGYIVVSLNGEPAQEYSLQDIRDGKIPGIIVSGNSIITAFGSAGRTQQEKEFASLKKEINEALQPTPPKNRQERRAEKALARGRKK